MEKEVRRDSVTDVGDARGTDYETPSDARLKRRGGKSKASQKFILDRRHTKPQTTNKSILIIKHFH